MSNREIQSGKDWKSLKIIKIKISQFYSIEKTDLHTRLHYINTKKTSHAKSKKAP